MKHVCCSDLPLPREDSLPYSIRKVDVSLYMFIASATNSGKVLPNDNKLHIVNMLWRLCGGRVNQSHWEGRGGAKLSWAGCEGAGACCGCGNLGQRHRHYTSEKSWKWLSEGSPPFNHQVPNWCPFLFGLGENQPLAWFIVHLNRYNP